jgi:Ca2+-binding RTX toxin-like protein
VLWGGEGNDAVYGGSGQDTMAGGEDNDTLFGFNGDDSLTGEGGNDSLNGGAGNDILDGGEGKDTLQGSTGSDTFVFSDITHSTDAAQDRILDFVRGTDIIDLTGLGLTFADISITLSGGFTTVADIHSTFSFQLMGIFALDATDFVF